MNKQYCYLNPVQYTSNLIYANQEIQIAGRGTGKSKGIIAPRIKRWCEEMPRATIIGEAATYVQHFTRTLPEIFAGFNMLGWHENEDFWVGKYAPDKFKIDKPLTKPIRTDYMIHTRTGAAIVLVSHDIKGSSNGLSAQALFGDEAKFLSYEKHKDEVIPAIRGANHLFGEKSCYQAMLLTSDMPVSNDAQWILELGDANHDEERIQMILELQLEQIELINKVKLRADDYTANTIDIYNDRIVFLEKYLVSMRKGDAAAGVKPAFFFQESSSLANINILGAAYFDKMKTNLSPSDYNTTILSLRQKQIKNGFYPDLSESKHSYTMYNIGFIESLGHDLTNYKDMDCRQDMDIDPDAPLDIALDYGGNFNCMVVGQLNDSTYRYLHGFHVHHPLKLKDLITQFKKYYRHHTNKHVRFFYDHTAKPNTPTDELMYYETVAQALRSSTDYEWTVELNYLGVTSSYAARYELWSKILGTEVLPIDFQYHKVHCEDWSTSCMLAPVKQVDQKLEKDKSSERNPKVKAERSTHYSDAGDTLAIGAILPLLNLTSYEFTGIR